MNKRMWVVNASPVILLGEIGRISLLNALSETMVIPKAVATEIFAGPYEDVAQRWLRSEGNIYVQEEQPLDVPIAGWDLGAGESAVLTWAHKHSGYEAILDDRAARNCAAAFHIPVRGTLGVLLLAKREGLINQVHPLFDALVEAGLRIAPDVLKAALRLAEEANSTGSKHNSDTPPVPPS